MTDTIHSDLCREAERQQKAWAAKWPNYCKRCEGQGGIHHPSLSYLDPPEDWPCECIESGRCPRCASTTVLYHEEDHCDYLDCALCGWDERRSALENRDTDRNGEMLWLPTWECYCEEFSDQEAV